MRAAIIHASSGKVQNVIELADDHDPDAEGAYTPPPGHRLEVDPDGRAVIGGHHDADTGEWTPPEPLEVVDEATLEEEAEAAFVTAVEAATTIAELKAAILGTKGPGAQPRRPQARP